MQPDSGGSSYGNAISSCQFLSQLTLPDSKDVKIMLNQLGYVEEEKSIMPGVTVRLASVERLVSLAVDSFKSTDEEGLEMVRILFLTHLWFISSKKLAEMFVNSSIRYCDCHNSMPCLLPACSHQTSSTLNKCTIFQHKVAVCQAISYWINHYPMYFDQNQELKETIQRFQELIFQQNNESSELSRMVDISTVPSYDWLRNFSVHNTPGLIRSSSSSRRVTLVFNNLQPLELAEQLTFLEYRAFRRITVNDFKNYATTTSLKDNARLEHSIALFNGLSQWIQCMVLSKTTPRQRANVIIKFTEVAKKLKQLNNFNSLMAVIGGLTHSCLARLTKTNSFLPLETQKVLSEYAELLSSNNNFCNYRKVLNQVKHEFRIPILGVHLRDLILLNTALPDKIEPDLINFRKMVQMSFIFNELMQVQTATFPLKPNMDLVNTIRLCLDLNYTEDEIYELSLAREPRTSLSSPTTPTKPVMFAEWVAGVSSPDPDTINKHVQDMIEAVFKNYDHDKDGFISQAEFESIAGNFPFIDSFAVLDADHDGLISREEMKVYFITANCHALRKCFKHDFHEITYFKPTFCIHCTGLLWGLIKQGWKCKDCGINAHRHCKDLVVMECRSRTSLGGSTRGSSLFGGGFGRDVTLASKRKMSRRQKTSRSSQSTQTDDTADDTNKRDSDIVDGYLSGASCSSSSEFQSSPDRASLKTQQVCDELLLENQLLKDRIELQDEEIKSLKAHIGMMRQHTLTFILDQMDTLHLDQDTAV